MHTTFEAELEKIASVHKPSIEHTGTAGFGLKPLIQGKSIVSRKPYAMEKNPEMGSMGGSINSTVKPPTPVKYIKGK